VPWCVLKTRKKGVKKGVKNNGLWVIKTERDRMKMTNRLKQVGDPEDFDEGTYTFAVSKKCFAPGRKLVRTKTHKLRLQRGGAQ
jgi:hypothetical protein